MIPRRWAHTYPGEWGDLAHWKDRGGDGGKYDSSPDLLAHWEAAFASRVGRSFAAAMHSGRSAMGLIFEHLGLGPGDEVILPAYTFGEILPVFESLGVKAVPADVDPHTFNMTPDAVRSRITNRTRAILALHIFGVPCEIQAIRALADEHGIAVVEDCAHSLGATIFGENTGRFGSAAFYSFDLTKLINTFGGGMVLTDDESLAGRVRDCNRERIEDSEPVIRKARVARMEQRLFQTRLMYPLLYLLATPQFKSTLNRVYRQGQSTLRSTTRFGELQAHLGLRKLETLDQRIEMRRRCGDVMRSLLRPDIQPQYVPPECQWSGYSFVVLLPCPAAPVRKRLLFRGIDAAIEGEVMDNCASMLGYDDCPVINRIFPRSMALPLYDGLRERDAERVALALNAVI